MHRWGGSIEALLGSEIEPSTGRILKPGNLSYQILIDNGLKSMTSVDLRPSFQDRVEAVLSGNEPSRFFDETSNIEFSYICNRVHSVADILEQKRKLSKQHSDNKIESARKGAPVEIGLLGKRFIMSVPHTSRIYRPDTTGEECPDVVRDNLAKSGKVYKNAGCDELKAFPIYAYMHQPEMIAYANDPFDSVNRLAIMNKFSFSAIGNPEIQLRPPYVINHKSLAVNPGRGH